MRYLCNVLDDSLFLYSKISFPLKPLKIFQKLQKNSGLKIIDHKMQGVYDTITSCTLCFINSDIFISLRQLSVLTDFGKHRLMKPDMDFHRREARPGPQPTRPQPQQQGALHQLL